MKILRGRSLAWALVPAAAGIEGIARAGGGRLAGGQAPDISIARIFAVLVIGILLAILAAFLIRQRGGRIAFRNVFGRIDFGSRAIQIVETRRLSQHADACLIRHDGKEYLLLLQAGSARLLSGKPLPAAPEIEPVPPCD